MNVGLFYLRQVFYAKFDLKVHTDKGLLIHFFSIPGIVFHFSIESEDYTQLWNSLRKKISLVNHVKESPGQSSFSHIIGGYDAGYYGYTFLVLHQKKEILTSTFTFQLHLLGSLCSRHVCDDLQERSS